MTKFKRYRDENGAEFSSAVSDELAEAKGWEDITSDETPATDRQGKPLPAKPAERKPAKADAKPTSRSASSSSAATTSTEA